MTREDDITLTTTRDRVASSRSDRASVSTVGLYQRHGLPLVEACAEAGTDYADLTGEVLFVAEAIERAHASARKTGARIVVSCGFDSVLDPEALSGGTVGTPGQRDQWRPFRDADHGRWAAPFVMGPFNTRIVRRTHALTGQGYGPHFRYRELIDTGRGAQGALRAYAVTAGTGLLVGAMTVPNLGGVVGVAQRKRLLIGVTKVGPELSRSFPVA